MGKNWKVKLNKNIIGVLSIGRNRIIVYLPMTLHTVVNVGNQFSIRKWVLNKTFKSSLFWLHSTKVIKTSTMIFTLYNTACTYLQVTMHHMPCMTVFYSTQNLCKLFTSLFFWQCTMGQIICKFKEVFIKHTTPALNSFTAFDQESDVLNIFININRIYRKRHKLKNCVLTTPDQLNWKPLNNYFSLLKMLC